MFMVVTGVEKKYAEKIFLILYRYIIIWHLSNRLPMLAHVCKYDDANYLYLIIEDFT